MNPTLTKASEALRESLSDWQGNGDLPAFAVIAVLRALKYDDSSDSEDRAVRIAAKYRIEVVSLIEAFDAMIDTITNYNPTANHGSGE